MHVGAILYVYKGEHGLPTIDFECLRVMCLVKFTRCPIEIKTDANPLHSGAGVLPYLHVGNKKFIGYRQIKDFLDKESYPIDSHLNRKQSYLAPTYANWVFNNLHAYYHYFMFGEPNNVDVTRALYAKRTPFPFSFYYPVSYQKEAHNIINAMAGFDIHDKIEQHQTEYLVENAKRCVNALSKKLAKRIWFFGEVFSELDAIVYSYLAILYNIVLPNNPLQIHIKGCQNIVNFINRITKDVFKNEAFNSIKISKTSSNDPMLTATERKFLESEKKTKIFSALGAIVAMASFAVWRGIYKQVKSSNGVYLGYEDDDDEDEDDSPE